MAVRPVPGWEAPPGTVHEPMVAAGWRLVSGEKRCRFMEARQACGAPAVVELNRSQHAHRGDENWWAYCPDHMYGRWIENGQVWQWRVAPIEEAAS